MEMKAWFVCRAGKLVDDIELRIRSGVTLPSDEVLAKRGRMRAARVFKLRHALHPCTRVEVEFMFVEGVEDAYVSQGVEAARLELARRDERA
jgi:hypothetical protein